MKVEELRIGNWVGCYGEHLQVEILEEGCDLAGINPIPLTPEILEQAGFAKESLTGLFIKYGLNGIDIWHNVSSNTFLLDNIKNKKVYIQHLHQLQNLYFALTGEELNVQL